MIQGLIAKKIGMSQQFDDAGNVVPVTVLKAGPCTVIQKKTADKDGYVYITDRNQGVWILRYTGPKPAGRVSE